MAQTKIAIFDLTGCQGCEFHLLSLNELLLDLFQDFEITNWRLLAESDKKDFDIAFVEGAATTPEHIKLLKEIRQTSKAVVALGACAISGNVFVELTPEQRKKLAPRIYDQNYQLKAEFLDPIEKHIKVDYKLPGCPPDIEKFKELLAQFKKETVSSEIKDVPPPDYLAKIEGHGSLKINFAKKEVIFEVEESERLVEGLLLGKNYKQAPFINSRICGICPIAHSLCSWKAIEAAWEIKPKMPTILLREMLLASQAVKSHLLHLFFLVLPDYAGLHSSIKLAQKYPAEFHLMLNIKRVSEQILQLVGGSTAFPTNLGLGGFIKPPKKEELLPLVEKIESVIDEAQDLIKLFAGFAVPEIKSELGFLTTQPPENQYPLYQSDFIPQIKEIVKKDSTAKLGFLKDGGIIKVGALARLARFNAKLNPQASKTFQEHQPGPDNPFNNNLAQAIEILHYLEEIKGSINLLLKEDLNLAKVVSEPGVMEKQGSACLEAPRGVLIHQVSLDQEGKIKKYNIIPPTQINLLSLEKEAELLIEEHHQLEPKKLEDEVEKLIRAFDPCITCAVH